MKNFFYLAMALCISVTVISCGDDDENDLVPQTMSQSSLKVSSSVELLGSINSTTTITVSVESDASWTISGVPEWLSCNKSGVGSTILTLTATQENLSDEPRKANLVFSTTDGKVSAECVVIQKGLLASNCKVTFGDMTVMCDGFVVDMTFSNNCKGFRNLLISASELSNLTDRDIWDLLMNQTERTGTVEYMYSPIINPGTEVVLCIAAYGSETNEDGTHKYGPMTMKKVTIRHETPEADMYLTLTYTSTTWKVTTSRLGSYGQKCDEYYYFALEGENATSLATLLQNYSSAYIAYKIFIPAIKNDPLGCYKYGPQTMQFSRSQNSFVLCTWGRSRDTKELSAELSSIYKNLTSSAEKISVRKTPAKDFKMGQMYDGTNELDNLGSSVVCIKELAF